MSLPSVFKPVNPMFYEQINGQFAGYSSDKVVIRKSPTNDNSSAAGRRYRQSELTQQISSIQNEIFQVSQSLANSRPNSPSIVSNNYKLKYLEAILKQKQKHLLRLQKNVVVQKTIRNKKRTTISQDN